LGPKKVGKIVI